MDCPHNITARRIGDKALYCKACGVKVFDVDQRECGDCDEYMQSGMRGICTKHMMGVTIDMHVTFSVSEGTCWKPKELE